MSRTWFDTRQTADFLGISRSTIFRYAKRRELPHIRKRFGLRFKKEDLEAWLEKDRRKPLSVLPILQESLTNLSPIVINESKGGEMPKGKSQTRLTFVINGESFISGTVYQRKTQKGKRWCINFVDPKGKRIRKVASLAQSREDACIVLREEIQKVFDHEYAVRRGREKIRFEDFAELYLEKYAKSNKKSWKTDAYYLRDMVEFFCDRYLIDLASEDIEDYKKAKLRHNVRESTVNRHLAVLRKMFNLAKDWDYYPEGRKIKFKFFSERDNIKERILSEAEEKRLLSESSQHLRSILIIALNTGMRLGEILGLRWNQVDFENRSIRVEGTKAGRSRSIEVNPNLFDELQKLRIRNCQSYFVFLNPKTGEPLTTVKRAFKAACRRANIEGLRFHDTRHTFATRLIEKGADLITVKELLGHSTVRITERYTHPSLETKRRAVELLSEKNIDTIKFLSVTSPKTSPRSTKNLKADLNPFYSDN